MYHKLIVVGNLGGDPELRYTKDGVPVANFSLAANRRWKRPDGGQGEETVWFRVSAWRRLAEVCDEYLSKGRRVLVEGRLRADPESGGPRLWSGKDGETRASFEMTAQTVKFLGGREGTAATDEPAAGSDPEPLDEPEEEIPF